MVLNLCCMIMTSKSVFPTSAGFKLRFSMFSDLCPISSSDSQFLQLRRLSACRRRTDEAASGTSCRVRAELPSSGGSVCVERDAGREQAAGRMLGQPLWSEVAQDAVSHRSLGCHESNRSPGSQVSLVSVF